MTENKPGRAHLKIVISTAVVIAAMVLTMQLISQARQLQVLKTELAEVNHIRYGLFNTDEWAYQLATILSMKIVEFKLTPDNREVVIQNLEGILNLMIDEVEVMLRQEAAAKLSGMKGFLSGFVINLDLLRDSVPSYANTLLTELSNPDNKEFMQQFLLDKLGEITVSTYNLDSMDPLQAVMEKYSSSSKEESKKLISEQIEMKEEVINNRVLLILLLVCAVYLLNLITRNKINKTQSTLLILAAFTLLLGGITTPMIDLEAKIDLLSLKLMGEDVIFQNNIIFFQSKSITDVVRILVQEGSLQMIFVGVLVFTFSIIFPAAKLISSLLYVYSVRNLRENGLIRFFVIQSGKWSMADV
ncbi:MAG: paraquat-inducible protein A, partial [Bacteroidales bacterium]|nr:paraquat-inducible protein A [Bacteroidales bacterium]